MISTTFYIESELLDYLDATAAQYDVSRSLVLRRLLRLCRATPNLLLFR